MQKLVYFPAEFTHSDHAGSKVTWCYQFLNTLADKKIYSITAYFNNREEKIGKETINVRCMKKTFNPKPNIFQVGLFQLWLVYVAIYKRRELKEASVIHHFGNFGNRTSLNLPLLLGLIDKSKFIFGPIEEEVNVPGVKCKSMNVYQDMIISLLYNAFLKQLVKLTLKKSAVVIYQGEGAKKYYERIYKNPRSVLLNPGIITSAHQTVKSKLVKNPIKLITMCELNELKRVDLMIRIVKELRNTFNVHLVIVGSGMEYGNLRNLASTLDIENSVTFTGKIGHEKVLEKLQECHIFLNCSMYESFGQAMLEASYCGLPVIATDTPGARIIIANGTTGYLIPKKDNELPVFCSKISMLINDENLYRRMSRASIRRVQDIFSWDSICDKYIQLYKDLNLSRQGKTSGIISPL